MKANPQLHANIRRLSADGHTAAYIALALGCSKKTVERVRDPARHKHSQRTLDAAAKLLHTPSLGPIEFRTAVAGWLNENATITRRLEGNSWTQAHQTLPCVLAILDVIERAS